MSYREDNGEDSFYTLSPKAIRWLKLQRQYEAGTIMGHEARERLLLTEELGIVLTTEERRGFDLREQLFGAGYPPYQGEATK